jgi:hypothetical protein
MKNLIRFTSFFLLFILTLSGCYFDKENELYPSNGNCDTAGVMTYSRSIAPIMVANCNVCHNSKSHEGGIITDNYDDLYTIAGKDGQLWPAVNWTGGVHMPKGTDKLSACDLTKIKKWIDADAPRN